MYSRVLGHAVACKRCGNLFRSPISLLYHLKWQFCHPINSVLEMRNLKKMEEKFDNRRAIGKSLPPSLRSLNLRHRSNAAESSDRVAEIRSKLEKLREVKEKVVKAKKYFESLPSDFVIVDDAARDVLGIDKAEDEIANCLLMLSKDAEDLDVSGEFKNPAVSGTEPGELPHGEEEGKESVVDKVVANADSGRNGGIYEFTLGPLQLLSRRRP